MDVVLDALDPNAAALVRRNPSSHREAPYPNERQADRARQARGHDAANDNGLAAAASLSLNRTWQSGLPLDWHGLLPAPTRLGIARATQLALKRILDLALSIPVLILLLPLLSVIALAIKLTSPGPVFFRQTRVGLNGEKFRLLKFRTMYSERNDHSGIAQTTQNDPRVTPLGRLLRKTSLDELPQLLHIVSGKMSLVGPRRMSRACWPAAATIATSSPITTCATR